MTTIDSTELHIWQIPLPDHKALPPRIDSGLLGAAESARLAELKHPQLKLDYLSCRCAMRLILATYLNESAKDLAILIGEKGKPYLTPGRYAADLRFNLSHSGSLALLAVAKERELGVDIERHRPGLSISRIVKRYFAEPLIARLEQLDEDTRRGAFHNLWTLLEAYQKAQGKGLSVAKEKFDWPVHSRAINRLAPLAVKSAQPKWLFANLETPMGYSASVVAEQLAEDDDGKPPRIEYFYYTNERPG